MSRGVFGWDLPPGCTSRDIEDAYGGGEETMRITRVSPMTGKANEMDLPITEEQMEEFTSGSRRHVQDIFPDLTGPEREFVKTGYTAEDWLAMFPPEDEDDQDDVRRAREADHVDGYDRDDLGESPDF